MERSKRRSRFRLVASALAVAIPLALIPAGSAGAVTINAAEECCSFVGSPFSQSAGTTTEFSNPGGPNRVPHNVYSKGTGPDGGSLFYSKTIGPGMTTPVDGTEYLATGRYPFVCTLHSGMNGVLDVTSGTPVARPKVTPTIRSRSLAAVRSKGAIDLSLKASTSTGPVTVTITANGKQVATKRIGSLRSGEVRKISAKLTPKGRKAIAKGSTVRFNVRSWAEFGLVLTASKALQAGK
ncbi:MAG: hypothetical protein ACKORM_07000 [Solirubrobacterales bacterium]